ncbi:MAG TPA: dihydrodipicolinate synthase family protein [Candidatus Aquilonibacter sp.]|nr:dihydrodipicolinate synthase family protein [Candidatus Aquilonibacter sp.]
MPAKQFSGVHAALLTPRKSDGAVDAAALTRLVQFLLARGIWKFALNGATGEFPLMRPQDLEVALETVRSAAQGRAQILCGIGGIGIGPSRELAAIAQERGANGLLLPMPYFFRYEQHDLNAFCREAAKSTDLPILLYNLPQFSTGLAKETVRTLIESVPNIVGIKDSGGSLDILRDLTEHEVEACRIVGNDPVLRPALSEAVCDGIVSGIACVLPELILRLYEQGNQASCARFDDSWRSLREIARQLDSFPTPWALKWIAQARGIFDASFAQPLSAERAARGAELKSWFPEWFAAAVPGGALTF